MERAGGGHRFLLALAVLLTFIVPLGIGGVDLRVFKFVAMQYALVGVLLWHLSDNYWMKFFGVAVAASWAVGDNIYSLISVFTVVVGYGLYWVSTRVLRGHMDTFLDVLCGVVIAQTLYQFVQVGGYDFLFQAVPGHGGRELWVGFSGNSNCLAFLQAFALPAMFRRRLLVLLSPLLFVGLHLSGTATAVIALAIGGGVALLVRQYQKDGIKVVLAGAVAAAFLCIYVEQVDSDTVLGNHRWLVWADTVEAIGDKPLEGHGLGSYKYGGFGHHRPEGDGWTRFAQAHNEYLQVGYELGLVALTLVMGFVVTTGAYLLRPSAIYKPVYAAMFLVLAVSAFGHFPFHTPDNALWSVMFLGGVRGDRLH